RHIDYIVDVVGEFDDLEYDYVIFLGKLRELIQKHLDSPKPDIRVKYSWLKEKYNEAVGYQHTVANRFSDPDLAESFLSLSLLS
ncbi:MAG: hypothetical protein OET90_01585, partial [Desulfuromonadales bacterium]|nr:hypothetical protein [Desulfuromonadales bacterium]